MSNQSITDYLAALAAGRATPGGGSVAALNGAMAAALLCMVCKLSLKRNLPTDVEQRLKTVLAEAEPLQIKLRRLSAADSQAYQGVVEAQRLPKQTEAERLARTQALEQAYRQATHTPLQTALACAKIITLAETLVNHGRAAAAADVGAAALSALAGLKTAQLNIIINLKFSRDDAFKQTIQAELDTIAPNLDQLATQIYHRAQKR